VLKLLILLNCENITAAHPVVGRVRVSLAHQSNSFLRVACACACVCVCVCVCVCKLPSVIFLYINRYSFN
jgi:hypothetical protein